MVREADGSEPAKSLTHMTIPNVVIGDLKWSPDGTKIVFEWALKPDGMTPGPWTLWLVNSDGTGLKILTPWENNTDLSLNFRWLPDGTKIVFNSIRGLDGVWDSSRSDCCVSNIWTVNTDGTGLAALTRLTLSETGEFANNVSPQVSPDGNHIIFLSNKKLNPSDVLSAPIWNLWVMNSDGSGSKPLTNLTAANVAYNPVSEFSPMGAQWSPDGTKIAVALGSKIPNSNPRLLQDNVWGPSNIMILDVNGVAPAKLLTHTTAINVDSVDPQWSPDGKSIVFKSVRNPSGADSSNSRQSECQNDSDWPACALTLSNIWSVSMNPDGITWGNPRVLTTATYTSASSMATATNPNFVTGVINGNFSPRWSPDGKKIAFSSDVNTGDDPLIPDPNSQEAVATGHFRFFVMNADGTGIKKLTDPNPLANYNETPQWPLPINLNPKTVAARITTTDAVIFAQPGVMSDSIEQYDVYRKESSDNYSTSRKIATQSKQVMQEEGYFNSGLTEGVNYEYALQPIYRDRQLGAMTPFVPTSWDSGQFHLKIIGYPAFNYGAQMLVDYIAATPSSSPAAPSPVTVVGNGIADGSEGLGFYADNNCNSGGSCVSQIQFQPSLSVPPGVILWVSYIDYRENQQRLALEDNHKGAPSQVFWLVIGDLAKLTTQQLRHVFKYVQGPAGIEANLYQPLNNTVFPSPLPAMDLTACTVKTTSFDCLSPVRGPLVAVSIPMPDFTTAWTNPASEKLYKYIGEDSDALKTNWTNWAQNNLATVFPNFRFDPSFRMSDSFPDLSHTSINKIWLLETLDFINLIIFDRMPGNKIFGDGIPFHPSGQLAFNKVFAPKFVPVDSGFPGLSNDQSLESSENLGYIAQAFFHTFSSTLERINQIPFDLNNLIIDSDRGKYVRFLQTTGCLQEHTSSQWWPGDGSNCVGGRSISNPIICSPELACKGDDTASYQKKFDGYDFSSHHVHGYLEDFKNYVVHLPQNSPFSTAANNVVKVLSNARDHNNLKFASFEDRTGEEEEGTVVRVDSCYCIFKDTPENSPFTSVPDSLAILAHEGAHLYHESQVLSGSQAMDAADESNQALMGAKWSMWTEFRAFKFEDCLFGKPSCINDAQFPNSPTGRAALITAKKNFLKTIFLPDENRRKLYMDGWEAAGICTKNHDGHTLSGCKTIDDLDWLPFDRTTGQDICNPLTNQVGPCPAGLP
jgi:Tol biopolymer transport system component